MSKKSTSQKEEEQEKRDYEIYKELKNRYDLENQRNNHLHDKAIQIASSTGTIMAIFIGLATFSLEKISKSNIYFPWLTLVIMFSLTLFIAVIIITLFIIKPSEYTFTDPRQFIEEYKNKTWSELIHFYGGDIITAIEKNKEQNDEKVKRILWALISLTAGLISIIIFTLLMIYALMN